MLVLQAHTCRTVDAQYQVVEMFSLLVSSAAYQLANNIFLSQQISISQAQQRRNQPVNRVAFSTSLLVALFSFEDTVVSLRMTGGWSTIEDHFLSCSYFQFQRLKLQRRTASRIYISSSRTNMQHWHQISTRCEDKVTRTQPSPHIGTTKVIYLGISRRKKG